MKIYVASSWRNPFQPAIVAALQKLSQLDVYDFRNPPNRTGFSWSQISEDWQHWTTEQYLSMLETPVAQAGFDSDFNAMKAADLCILVTPSGPSSHLEAGWFIGNGKPLYIMIPVKGEPDLMYKMATKIYHDPYELFSQVIKDALKLEEKAND